MKARFYLAMVVLVLAAPVFAQEAAMAPSTGGNIANLEAGFPAAIIDTNVTETGVIELGVAGAYVTNGAVYETGLVQVNYGVMPNVQASAKWPMILGEGLVAGNGDTVVAVTAGLLEEDADMPALGLEVAGKAPTGRGFTGYDGTVTGVLTKTFGDMRLHVNAGYTTIGNNVTANRADADSFKVGIDFPLIDNVVMIVDAFSDEAPVKGADRIEAVEAGIRCALTDVDILSVGVGAGVGNGNATPAFVAVVGYQRAL